MGVKNSQQYSYVMPRPPNLLRRFVSTIEVWLLYMGSYEPIGKARMGYDIYVPYSLPRLISMGIQCSFLTYFFEMYVGEFGWTMSEYGTMPTIYSRTQTGSFLIFGLIFKFVIKEIKGTKGILMAGTITHWITYFLLIILPIKWHGVKTPYVDSIFGNVGKIWNLESWKPIFKGPVPLSSMSSHKHWYRFMHILWPFVKLVWIPLYPLMKVCFLCIVNFGAIWDVICIVIGPLWICCKYTCMPVKYVGRGLWFIISLPFRALWYPLGLAWRSIQTRRRSDAMCFSCCQTPKPPPIPTIKPWPRPLPLENPDPNNILIDHRRLPPRAPYRPKNYPDASAIPDPPVDLDLLKQIWDAAQAQISGSNSGSLARNLARWKEFMQTKTFGIYFITFVHGIGVSAHELSNKALEGYVGIGALNLNLSFFFASNIFIYLLFSLLKFFVREKTFFADAFYILAILFFVLQIPILIYFFIGTTGTGGSSKEIEGTLPSYVCLIFKWLSVTVFHSTVVFLIFSGGPLIKYVAIFILKGHKVLTSFGTLVLFGALIGMSWLNMILEKFGKAENAFNPDTQMKAVGICIFGQLFTFLLFIRFNYWWNKNNWLNYIIFILTGAVNSKFVAYANIMLATGVTLDVRVGDWKWLASGGFYSGTNMVVSWAMPKIFTAFDQNETRRFGCKCLRIPYPYCFPTVYNMMTGLFIFANAIAFGIYFLVHYFDKLMAAVAKLKAKANDLKDKADAFKNASGNTDKLKTFRAAAAALEAAGKALKELGDLVAAFSQKATATNETKLSTVITKLKTQATTFRDACGPPNETTPNDNSFYALSHQLNTQFNSIFKNARFNFGPQDQSKSAAKKFNDFYDALGSNPNLADLQGAANEFQQAANFFAFATKKFNEAANHNVVTNDDGNSLDQDQIPANFQGAAGSFNTAANGLFTDIKPIAYSSR